MKNFLKLASNVDVLPIMTELHRYPELWDEHSLRTKHPLTAHREVSDIWVWFNRIPKNQNDIIDDKDVIPYRAWRRVPSIRPIVFAIMRQVEAVRLGRVIITKLPPGGKITPHVDGGAPAEYYQRYQVALQCLPGNIFKSGNEEVSFRTGEVWQINNRVLHSVINNSEDDRIVMIVDARSE